jgi:hypothetical protein
VSGSNSHKRRRTEHQAKMAKNFRRRGSDPLATKIGRVMSDPAMRELCLALKFGESTTAHIAEGFKVTITRLEGDELERDDQRARISLVT